MVEFAFINILTKHPKHEFNGFTKNHITPLLDKLSPENKDIKIMGGFNINLKLTIQNFLETTLSQSFLPYITTPTRITTNTKH